jgi:hypothetical protein
LAGGQAGRVTERVTSIEEADAADANIVEGGWIMATR